MLEVQSYLQRYTGPVTYFPTLERAADLVVNMDETEWQPVCVSLNNGASWVIAFFDDEGLVGVL